MAIKILNSISNLLFLNHLTRIAFSISFLRVLEVFDYSVLHLYFMRLSSFFLSSISSVTSPLSFIIAEVFLFLLNLFKRFLRAFELFGQCFFNNSLLIFDLLCQDTLDNLFFEVVITVRQSFFIKILKVFQLY